MENEYHLQVHSALQKQYEDDSTSRFGKFYTRRRQKPNTSTLNNDLPVTAPLQQVTNAVPIQVSLQSIAPPLNAATRRRAVRSRRTNFDSIISFTGLLHKLTARGMNTVRSGRVRKSLTDEQLAAVRAKGAMRQRRARLNQTAEQRAAKQAKDTARKRAYRQRIRQAKMMIKDEGKDCSCQLESVTKPSTLSSRERATIRKRNSRLKQTAEQRAANRAINTVRRREARQRIRQAKMMMTNEHGNDTHICQPESVDVKLTLSSSAIIS